MTVNSNSFDRHSSENYCTCRRLPAESANEYFPTKYTKKT